MKRHVVIGGAVVCLMLMVTVTGLAETPVRDHDIVLEDYYTVGTLTSCAVSPDARYVAYTDYRWDPPAEKRNSDLWVVEVATKEVRRLTFNKANEGSVNWSPDGRYIYFTSNQKREAEKLPPYNGKKQVWRMFPDGSGLQAVTREEDGIGQFHLSADGKSLYYLISEEVYEEEWKDLKKKFKDYEFGHGVDEFSQIWRLDLVHWRKEKLVDEQRVIKSFDVSSDESRISMVTTPDGTLLKNEGWSRVDMWDAGTKSVSIVTKDGWRKGHPSPYGWVEGASFAVDGKAISFTVSFDGFPTMLYAGDLTGGEFVMHEATRPAGVEVTGGTIKWRGDKREVCFIGEDHARARVYCIADPTSGGTAMTAGDVVVTSYSFSESGDKVAAVLSTTEHPRDIFLYGRSGTGERLTHSNPQVDTWKLPQISIVKWIGADGDEVEGILELPPDYEPGTPLPMVVELHGGPTAATMLRLRFWIYGRTLLAAKGYALFSPNYRGSTGYGDEFMTDLIGRENDVEVKDILAGVDAMVERGIADPERMGVMGWSNGGYLTNCLIAATDRFAAASSGAGVLDMVIQWGTEDTPGHVVNYTRGLPWNEHEEYRKASPLYDLDKVTTPTIIHVGGGDARVPAAHSRALYRGLRHYLNVPTELVVYPGEGHGLTTYKNRGAKIEWDIAWFEKYLTKMTEVPKEEPKPDDAT